LAGCVADFARVCSAEKVSGLCRHRRREQWIRQTDRRQSATTYSGDSRAKSKTLAFAETIPATVAETIAATIPATIAATIAETVAETIAGTIAETIAGTVAGTQRVSVTGAFAGAQRICFADRQHVSQSVA